MRRGLSGTPRESRNWPTAGSGGLAYEVFEIELYREAQPILLGMLRKGTLARLAQEKCKRQGWKFFVHDDDMRLLRSSGTDRDRYLGDRRHTCRSVGFQHVKASEARSSVAAVRSARGSERRP